MKQPRTSAFDPKFPAHKLKSPLESFPAIEKPIRPTDTEDTRTDSTPRTTVLPVRGVPQAITTRRKIKSRHPFDIYEDQIEELRQLSLEDRKRGGMGSMSAMVREALDDFIAKKRS